MRRFFSLIVPAVLLGAAYWLFSDRAEQRAISASPPTSEIAERKVDVKAASGWRMQKRRSSMDDSQSVFLEIYSATDIPKKYGSARQLARLQVRCVENTTAVLLYFGDFFLADINGYGTVRYRINAEEALSKNFRASTDNEVLGLWSGGVSIPFIKALFGANLLTVQVTPFNESPIETSFSIAGLENEIAPLREACGW